MSHDWVVDMDYLHLYQNMAVPKFNYSYVMGVTQLSHYSKDTIEWHKCKLTICEDNIEKCKRNDQLRKRKLLNEQKRIKGQIKFHRQLFPEEYL